MLEETRTITGRTIEDITLLARPGALSIDGFLGAEEDILSVIKRDNRLVRKLALTHPELARTLFHVLNLTEYHLESQSYYPNIRHHATYPPFLYNGHRLEATVSYTKGGQKSIFHDGVEGALGIRIWRRISSSGRSFL